MVVPEVRNSPDAQAGWRRDREHRIRRWTHRPTARWSIRGQQTWRGWPDENGSPRIRQGWDPRECGVSGANRYTHAPAWRQPPAADHREDGGGTTRRPFREA